MIKHVYVHIPFCINKCGYCSFFSLPLSSNSSNRKHNKQLNEYIRVLKQEIQSYLARLNVKPQTIYLGGGTPSLLEPNHVYDILTLFDLSDLTECTLEVNPGTINKTKTASLYNLPINRISLGIQSFNNDELQGLGRIHSVEDNVNAMNILREQGFDNISIDLMYGIPNQNFDSLQNSMNIIKKIHPHHISAYCLSLEPDSPMFLEGVRVAEDEICADFYRYIQKTLIDLGYNQYEISNFAEKGKESKHNLGYWNMEQYIGFGAGAHSLVNNNRYFNPSCLEEYYDNVKNNRHYPHKTEQTIQENMDDYVIQGLRLAKGIIYRDFNEKFNDDFKSRYAKPLEKYAPYLIIDKNSVKLKDKNYFVSNEILSGFLS